MFVLRKPSVRARAPLATIAVLAIYLALRSVMQSERALLIGLSLIVFRIIIDQMWERRGDWWFWLALSILGCVHAFVLLVVRAPGPWATLAVALPFMLVDGFAMWAILSWIEKRMSKYAA